MGRLVSYLVAGEFPIVACSSPACQRRRKVSLIAFQMIENAKNTQPFDK